MNWKICGSIGEYFIIAANDEFKQRIYNLVKIREEFPTGGYYSLGYILAVKGFKNTWQLTQKIEKELENI